MRLKALEMQGFKSFPDKTRLNFNQGITVVVGPNGSGKSNITDAVRWVLGEMSTKNIRGSKMEDVIFGGSDNRRPMGYAEVTLVIDNTVGIGKLDSEYAEVTVTRRYYRGGDSEYLINGKQARLKDIAELFMNTGVGKTGYSNIGQGKIAEIISQKSDERRSVFEEAAGISKYRYKKNEAERKLKDAEANLIRVGDILSGLEGRVGPLEKEANTARKYLALYEQKKEVDVALWLYDAETMRTRANETERAYMASKLELEGADAENSALEQKSERLYQSASENQAALAELTERSSDYVNRRHTLESSSRVLENDILHVQSRIAQTENELAARRDSLAEGEKKAAELADTLEKCETSLADILTKLIGNEQSAREQKQVCEDAEKAILDREDDEKLCEAALVDLKVRLSALEGSHEAESGRSAGLEAEIAAADALITGLTGEVGQKQETVDAYHAAIEKEKTALNEELSRCQALTEEGEEIREKVNALTLSAETKRQRAETLQRMDDLLEGYSHSVKNVMRGAESRQLHGICGPVSRVITVGKPYSIAIETALGANLQNIITEDEEAAKGAIAFLKRTNGGRATFYPITSVKAQSSPVSPDELKRHPGYVGMASALCRNDKKYDGILGNLLGKTAVFDTLDHAAAAAGATGYRMRFVTLDGQLINAGGSFTGGSVKSDSGILTRSAEIAGIREAIAGIEAEKKKLNDALAEKLKEIAGYRNSTDGRSQQISLLSALMQAENTGLEVAKTRLAAETEKRDALLSDLRGLGEAHEHYDSERRALQEQIAGAEEDLREAVEKTRLAVRRRNDADDLAYRLNEEQNRLMIDRTAAEKDLEATRNGIALNSGTVQALKEQITRSEELIYTLNEKLIADRNTVSGNKLDADALEGDISELERKRQALLALGLDYEKQQSVIREKLKEVTHRRENILKEYTRLENKREQLTAEHDRLAAKIWEDYELTYSQAAGLGYAPVTEETRTAYGSRQTELKNKIRALGSVNVGAIEEYEDVKSRYDFNKAQFEDLTRARESLDGIIGRLEREMRAKFTEAFAEINKNFRITFKELFGGGNAEISLSDPENVLTSGIEINVAPPGKIIKNLISLSGGEQAFVAIALIFAILNVNPTPFCIFDEIESALDEVNVVRLAEYMKRYSEHTQFIAITHRRGTMEASDMLYGITMPDRGISKVLCMNVSEVEQKMGGKYNR